MTEREDTLTDKILRKIKNTPLIAILIVLTIVVIHFAASLEAIKKIFSIFEQPNSIISQPTSENEINPIKLRNPQSPTFTLQPPDKWCKDNDLDKQNKRNLGCPGY